MRPAFIPFGRHLLLGSLLPAAVAAGASLTFNEHIRPIFAANCLACHGPDKKKREASLRLDLASSALADRDGVRAIVQGDLENSELWWRINSRYEDEVMPPPDSHKPPLKPAERALLRRWIEQGAVYQKHWAYEPVIRQRVPEVSGAGDRPIDRFVAARLEPADLSLAPEAPREELLRRLTLDLTGLPPSIKELDAFLADHIPGSYARAVDRLLASPPLRRTLRALLAGCRPLRRHPRPPPRQHSHHLALS